MKKSELFFPSSDKQTNIHMVMWEPDEEVLGVIQVVHGITEHIMRYEELAYYFTNRGMAVVGIDLLGHGLSTNNGQKVMYFGENGSWNYAVEDVNRCLVHIKEMYPDVPCTMLGFSLGSFLVRTHLIDNPGLVDAAILVGTGYTSKLEISLAQTVVKSEKRKYGDNVATDKIRSLTFETYNKKFKSNRTDCDWLCSDVEALDEYISDPLRGENITVGLFRELLNGMKYTNDKNNICKMSQMKPILFLSGDKDAVGNFGKGVEKAYNLYRSCHLEDVSIKLYENLRHDILHEKIKFNIFEDMYNWLKARKLVNERKEKEVIPVIQKQDSKKEENGSKTLVDSNEVVSVLTKSESVIKKEKRL